MTEHEPMFFFKVILDLQARSSEILVTALMAVEIPLLIERAVVTCLFYDVSLCVIIRWHGFSLTPKASSAHHTQHNPTPPSLLALSPYARSLRTANIVLSLFLNCFWMLTK